MQSLKKHRFVFKSLSFLIFAVLIATPVYSKKATPGGSKWILDPIMTDAGLVAGTMLGDAENIVRVYRGIPYAAPPVGELRWKPPQPVEPWDGIRECTHYTHWAPQPLTPGFVMSYDEASEDCLYLNVLTPAKKKNRLLPVVVWFHGGGLNTGSGNEPGYNTIDMSQQGNVVKVVVTTRLGPIGYMAHPLLSMEQGEGSGNYGTMDLIAALKWVQNNIAAFGGNPNRVAIVGSSGGGTKVTSLLVSPEAKGLFRGGIMQSGSHSFVPDGQLTLPQGEAMGEELMDVLASNEKLPASYTLEDMRDVSWIDIIEAVNEAGYQAQLTVDGWILPDMVYNIVQAGEQNDVPIIAGADEWENMFFGSITTAAEAWANVKSKCYVYVFTQMPGNWRDMYAPHGVPVWYVHGTLSDLTTYYFWIPYVKNLFHFPVDDPLWIEPSTPDPGIDEKDEWISEVMIRMWTRFAATGNPSLKRQVYWPAYDPEDPQYLEISYPLEIKDWDCNAFYPLAYDPPRCIYEP